MTGSSTQGIQTVLHPVTDLAAAKAVYTALLGISPQSDAPYYVGYEVAGQQIGLVPGGAAQGMSAPVAYWHVADIEAKLAEVTAAGATVKEPRTMSGAAAWWPPSPTPMATSSDCFSTNKRSYRLARVKSQWSPVGSSPAGDTLERGFPYPTTSRASRCASISSRVLHTGRNSPRAASVNWSPTCGEPG